MNTPRPFRTVLAGLALASTAAVLVGVQPASAAPPPPPHLVTATIRGTNPNGSESTKGTWQPAVSGNGRYFGYSVPNGQAYVKDLLTGATELVSVNNAGQPGDQYSNMVAVSDDGNRVLFISPAHNLVPGPWSTSDLYVRDRAAKKTIRMNMLNGSPMQVERADLSGDGKVVVFSSAVGGGIWRKTVSGNSVNRVDVSSIQVPANDSAGIDGVSVSQDGRYVVFASWADNLVPNDTNKLDDTFRRDTVGQTTTRVSLATGGVQGNASSFEPSVSDDGRYTAFYSYATNLVNNDTTQASDVFVHDSTLDTTRRVNLTSLGKESTGNVGSVAISGDGFSVMFTSNADDLVPGDGNGNYDIFVRDLFTASTRVVDTSTGGAISDQGAYGPSLSDDGTVSAFSSSGQNLISGDKNNTIDAFARVPESMGPHTALGTYASNVVKRFGADPSQAPWASANIANGHTTTAHYIVTLAQTAGAKDLAPVSRLYDAFFRRQPDPSGLNHWVTKHQHGSSLSKIATEFARSNEFKTKYGSTTNDGFVKLIYKNVLDRSPDAAGLAHWVAKLQTGTSRGDVMVAFSESSEGVRHLAPEVDSVVIGLKLLGVMPDKALYAQAVTARKAAGAAEGAALTYLDSATYAADH